MEIFWTKIFLHSLLMWYTLTIKLACFNLYSNYLCTFKNSARIFLIIFIQLFFHRRFIYTTLLEWPPFAQVSVWFVTISIVCPARRPVVIDDRYTASTLLSFCWVLIIKTIVVLNNDSIGKSGRSQLSAFQTETNFLCQEKRKRFFCRKNTCIWIFHRTSKHEHLDPGIFISYSPTAIIVISGPLSFIFLFFVHMKEHHSLIFMRIPGSLLHISMKWLCIFFNPFYNTCQTVQNINISERVFPS